MAVATENARKIPTTTRAAITAAHRHAKQQRLSTHVLCEIVTDAHQLSAFVVSPLENPTPQFSEGTISIIVDAEGTPVVHYDTCVGPRPVCNAADLVELAIYVLRTALGIYEGDTMVLVPNERYACPDWLCQIARTREQAA